MGKRVDGFVCFLLLAAGFYLYFRGAFENRLLCIVLALGCALISGKIFRTLFGRICRMNCFKKRSLRKKSGGVLMHLACMEHDAAFETLRQLLENNYDEDYQLVFLQQHPSLQLSQASIFETWRSKRECKHLLICTTGRADAAARIFAESLTCPKVAVVDADILSRLIAENPLSVPDAEGSASKGRLRLQQAGALLLRRRNAPRCFILSFSMLGMYLLSAKILYLACALALLFLTLLSLRGAKKPRKLF